MSAYLSRAGVIAALYFVVTIIFAPISYGLAQVRISEAFTVLAYFEPAAIPGLWLGAMMANVYGGFGPWDIFFGSGLTLVAAWLTWRIRKPALALLPPVVLNGVGIALMLKYILAIPDSAAISYPVAVLMVSAGEAVAVYVIGYPFLIYILKTKLFVRPEVFQRKLKGRVDHRSPNR